jgi:hypothetical protein
MKIACISDSPKITSGFGNVANQIYLGLHEEFEINVFGMLDWEPDVDKKLPYEFWPTSPMDPMGYNESLSFVQRINPDVVWIMTDPGNLIRWTASLLQLRDKFDYLHYKIFAYPPIEGTPVSPRYVEGFETILNDGGKVVLWCKAASDAVESQFGLKLPHVHFGSDHANFYRYTEEQRHKLRYLVNLHNSFIVGSVGVNKRTKGYDKMIYTARELKDRGEKNILFYCHTEPDRPTLQGYDLLKLIEVYDVRDMFLFKPVRNIESGNDYYGIKRNSNIVNELDEIRRPRTSKKRGELFASFDFNTVLNTFDIYFDTSQVEGWGMPQLEAMKTGIPTFMPRDYHVRDEVHGPGCYQYETIPHRYWDTWHTGARLVGLDPTVLADTIVMAKNSPEYLEELGELGKAHAEKYTWDNTRKKMNEHMREFNG